MPGDQLFECVAAAALRAFDEVPVDVCWSVVGKGIRVHVRSGSLDTRAIAV
jgi:hypothetical protein